MHSLIAGLLICVALALHSAGAYKPSEEEKEYGTFIGEFISHNKSHVINGTVYAISDSIFYIKNLTRGNDKLHSRFVVGKDYVPGPNGTEVTYTEDKVNKNIIISLPDNMKIYDLKYLCVWSSRFSMNFAHVDIESNLIFPRKQILNKFTEYAHQVKSGVVTILDSKTIYIPELHYDGQGPQAYFWVGKGDEPDVHGWKIPDHRKRTSVLPAFSGEDIELVLPDNLSVYDIDYLGIWCVDYLSNFGHVNIPKDIYVPPALGQTKIATSTTPAPGFSNCIELLNKRVQVEWESLGDDVQIRISALIRDDQYVAFGLSGKEGVAKMLGSDIVVVGYNKSSNTFFAEDYFVTVYSQCSDGKGVCPDKNKGGKNDAVFLSGERRDGLTIVMYKRPFRTNELQYDKIIPDVETTIIAAIGPLNNDYEANAHLLSDCTTENIQINFKGKGNHRCSKDFGNQPMKIALKPWPVMKISGVNTFSARIGPTGGDRGYTAITGLPSWGISWYINGILIPEITVERGKKYTFYVEGGNNLTNLAQYHPFYITDSPLGGLGRLKKADQHRERVFAGVAYDANNNPYPTALGRYCRYTQSIGGRSDFKTFKEFFATLKLECSEGTAYKLEWTVDQDTPDVVYYQCYTHANLGWKIRVVNKGGKNFSTGTLLLFSIVAFAVTLSHLI